ncbi:hypothetical protein SAMN05444411_102551 [Lutibacter oricola]|uniref:AB hydrolase-1 domain-containing protein n=1 Tax=Lutibacter oricola TaxID=762486 RepID=A0A1H2XU79_9FLAO|nr:alpha/beta fold hydrolase [Lutibacter oricola]SDW95879.1 hypothetical protein SAMN05444411_102551 [Lutibacter oricola]
MPIIESNYSPSFIFRNTHLNTVYKTLFLSSEIDYKRVRILTNDNDFLDLDFSLTGSKTLVIASHGLEGSSNSKYIVSVVKYLNSKQIDCLALNYRGCSGEDNHILQSYHSGRSDDLATVIKYVEENYNYQNIVLLGYSMGGNITLKYLGENNNIPSKIKGAITVSAPCDLEGSSYELSKTINKVYINRFLKSLKKKAQLKIEKFPEANFNYSEIISAKNFTEFDNSFTAPLFGYKNAQDYWRKNSSLPLLKTIRKPTLVLSALDDTFLSKSCYPFEAATNNTHIYLETPKYGGHVGFNTSTNKTKNLWSETRIHQFIQHIIS